MEEDFDAVIIGAGPAGSAAAILLARAGWSVALVEKQVYPRRKVCGECIAASNLALLDELGVGAAVRTAAGPELRTVVLMHAGDAVAAALPPAQDRRHPWGRALGRETLDGLLVDAARRDGARILQPWSVQAIEGGPGNWRCSLRAVASAQIRTLRARVAIAAHGSWEALPSGRDQRRGRRAPSDLFAFKANFLGTALAGGQLPVLCLDGGYGGMVIGDGGVMTIACCVRRDRLDELRTQAPGGSAGDAVEAWLRGQCRGVQQALEPARRIGAWMASGPLDPGARVRDDDALLRIGNAAGEVHPIIGEGISMALQSAALLAGCLQTDRSSAGNRARIPVPDVERQQAVAREYAAQWRGNFAQRLRIGALFAHAAMRPAASRMLMRAARQWPSLLTQGARWGGKTRGVGASILPLAKFDPGR